MTMRLPHRRPRLLSTIVNPLSGKISYRAPLGRCTATGACMTGRPGVVSANPVTWDIYEARPGALIVTSEERCALALLANDPNGVTEAMLVAHGFAVSMLARLVVDRLVIARHEIGGRTMDVVRVKITDAGRAALRG